MDVNQRIDKIKSFFITLNVSDGAICIVTKLPSKWEMPDKQYLIDEYKCQIAQQNGATFFMTEIENGFDTVFDCIDHIIILNKAIEEKAALLETKLKELKDLFVNESLDKLKTLQFVFVEAGKKKNSKSTMVLARVNKDEAKKEVADEQELQEDNNEQFQGREEDIVVEEDNSTLSSIMSTALQMAGE